jgi:putative nucleotidyltransferase with HDIG domain
MAVAFLKKAARNVLLKLLEQLDNDAEATAVTRARGGAFLQKEIRLPGFVVAGVGILAFFVVLIFEIGLSWLKIIGLAVFLAMMFFFFFRYLRRFHAELLADDEAIMLLGLVFVGAVLFMQLAKVWVSPLIIGVLNDFSLEYFFVHLSGIVAGVAALDGVRRRSDITRLGLKIAAVNMLAVIIIHFFRLWPVKTFGMNLLWAAVSGVSSALLVLGVLPFLESFFSKTTSIKLLELADFNQPLLKKLMMESPGTYHHSLIMASLAEQAAEAIGANSLMARVGAYYHDVGKLSNPEYFIENQQPDANPHDPLKPAMSSLVVISHVKEGVALARQYGIDKVIVDSIEQHHGTSLIHYFYHRALEQDKEITTESFRYPGPKPQTKENAILMIADAVEAASRSVEEHTPGRLKDIVEKVINNKFTDGQFSECPITLHDLGSIAESMAATLGGIYHARIEYQQPAGEKNEKA